MTCIHCARELPPGAAFCAYCGKKQIKKARSHKRANGEGSIRQQPDKTWRLELVLYYYYDEERQRTVPRTISKSGFAKKAEAAAYIPKLKELGFRRWGRTPNDGKKRPETFREVYEAWLPTHQASKSTLGNYKAAYRHFLPVHNRNMDEIYIDDLQECIDECPQGKRTKQTMKTMVGLVYKYAVPRQLVERPLILSQYLVINEKATESRRTGLTKDELERLRLAVGKVPYADYVYCMCYLGFRPGETMDLTVESYNREGRYFIGGAKTDAGKDRMVPVSPKIQHLIDALMRDKIGGYVFCDADGGRFDLRKFREIHFVAVLEAIGLTKEQREERLLTPHCCRHTFANLMRDVKGADKNKLALIGHTSEEMLRHYQDADLDGLWAIVNNL